MSTYNCSVNRDIEAYSKEEAITKFNQWLSQQSNLTEQVQVFEHKPILLQEEGADW